MSNAGSRATTPPDGAARRAVGSHRAYGGDKAMATPIDSPMVRPGRESGFANSDFRKQRVRAALANAAMDRVNDELERVIASMRASSPVFDEGDGDRDDGRGGVYDYHPDAEEPRRAGGGYDDDYSRSPDRSYGSDDGYESMGSPGGSSDGESIEFLRTAVKMQTMRGEFAARSIQRAVRSRHNPGADRRRHVEAIERAQRAASALSATRIQSAVRKRQHARKAVRQRAPRTRSPMSHVSESPSAASSLASFSPASAYSDGVACSVRKVHNAVQQEYRARQQPGIAEGAESSAVISPLSDKDHLERGQADGGAHFNTIKRSRPMVETHHSAGDEYESRALRSAKKIQRKVRNRLATLKKKKSGAGKGSRRKAAADKAAAAKAVEAARADDDSVGSIDSKQRRGRRESAYRAKPPAHKSREKSRSRTADLSKTEIDAKVALLDRQIRELMALKAGANPSRGRVAIL